LGASCLLRWMVLWGCCKGLYAGFGLEIDTCTQVQSLV